MTGASLLLYAAPGVPLALTLLALWPRARPWLFTMMPAAPLPALIAALFVLPGTVQPLPRTLLGAGLAMDGTGRIFLGVSALLWLIAGLYARTAIADERRGRFAGFWLATLAGNMLLFLSADLISFYFAFALLSLASFGLVVHGGTAEARRAGRVYLVLAILGETCLLLAFMIGADAAGSLILTDVRGAIPDAVNRDLALALLIAGFGLKAGLMPLHVWLPLAHPAAPVPASAVLSGAIVKAGIFGLIRFLPLEAPLPAWSDALTVMGLATAYLGIAAGLFQKRPKTLLAYSTISQMGLIVAVLGSAFGSTASGLAIAAVTLYAAHHGLAKGALFLSVGVLGKTGRASVTPILLATGLAALAIAGLPLSGGALAKMAIKGPLGEGTTALLIALSAAGTTALMLRFLWLARRSAPEEAGRPPMGLVLPFLACVAGAFTIPWLLFPGLTDFPAGYAIRPAAAWDALWPVLTGAAILIGMARLPRRPVFSVPEGDIVIPLERAVKTVVHIASVRDLRLPPVGLGWPGSLGSLLGNLERQLSDWRSAGTLLLALLVLWLAWTGIDGVGWDASSG